MWITSHTRMAIIFFFKENKSSAVIEKVEPLYSTDGRVNGSVVENISAIPQKLNMELMHDPAILCLGIHTKELEICTEINPCSHMFMAAPFTAGKS